MKRIENPGAAASSSVDPLVALYDQLNDLWKTAEADFAAMRIPVVVTHEVNRVPFGPPDDARVDGETITTLLWTRYQNQWRICWSKSNHCYGHDEFESEEKPILECPMEIRVSMARHLHKLRERMKKEREEYKAEVAEAIEQLRKALAI